MGARHLRSDVCHAHPIRGDPGRQNRAVFHARDDRAIPVHPVVKVPVRGPAARLDSRADRRVGALPARHPRNRPPDLVGDEESVHREPDRARGHFLAGHDAVWLPVRSTQHAGRDTRYHLHPAGPLLRGIVADHLSGGRYLERDRAQRRRARRDGGRASCALADVDEKAAGLEFLVAHVVIGKPVSTFLVPALEVIRCSTPCFAFSDWCARSCSPFSRIPAAVLRWSVRRSCSVLSSATRQPTTSTTSPTSHSTRIVPPSPAPCWPSSTAPACSIGWPISDGPATLPITSTIDARFWSFRSIRNSSDDCLPACRRRCR